MCGNFGFELEDSKIESDCLRVDIVLMKYSEEEILAYARSRIRFIDQQKGKRSILGFLGLGVIVMFITLIRMINEKSEKIGTDLLLDEKFLMGIAMGIMIFIFLGIAALGVVRMFGELYGKEIETCRLLVMLKDERNGYQPERGSPKGREDKD
jgi:hypothetical protein